MKKLNKNTDIITIDQSFSSQGLIFKGDNRVINNTDIKNMHKFVLTNMILNKGNATWTLIINKRSGWMAFGVCIREIVRDNGYIFAVPKGSPTGCFLLSSNCYLWNTNHKNENNIPYIKQTKIGSGTIVNFIYNCEKKELEISIGEDYKVLLSNVTAPEGNYLVPCAVLMAFEDEVNFTNGLILD